MVSPDLQLMEPQPARAELEAAKLQTELQPVQLLSPAQEVAATAIAVSTENRLSRAIP
jgi:hypothetical protein